MNFSFRRANSNARPPWERPGLARRRSARGRSPGRSNSRHATAAATGGAGSKFFQAAEPGIQQQGFAGCSSGVVWRLQRRAAVLGEAGKFAEQDTVAVVLLLDIRCS